MTFPASANGIRVPHEIHVVGKPDQGDNLVQERVHAHGTTGCRTPSISSCLAPDHESVKPGLGGTRGKLTSFSIVDGTQLIMVSVILFSEKGRVPRFAARDDNRIAVAAELVYFPVPRGYRYRGRHEDEERERGQRCAHDAG